MKIKLLNYLILLFLVYVFPFMIIASCESDKGFLMFPAFILVGVISSRCVSEIVSYE